jgi:transposase InsO family protein
MTIAEAKLFEEIQAVKKRKVVLEFAREYGKDSEAYQLFDVAHSTSYRWKKAYEAEGEAGLRRKKPVARHHPRQVSAEVIEKVVYLRQTYHLGPQRIAWYVERYHGAKVSCASVYRTLRRQGLSRLPKKVGRRAVHTHRYARQIPGHHVQVDVKFVTLKDPAGKPARRIQYTAIDDATRIRALKIYQRHNQTNAISFLDYVLEKFPFRIQTIRTDRGHEFQAQFHWHVEDKGIRHVHIKPRSPQLNGKVERSHRSYGEEFYQLLSYTDDVDLNRKLAEWEHFYNFNRPHGAHDGKTPYEALRSILKQPWKCLTKYAILHLT